VIVGLHHDPQVAAAHRQHCSVDTEVTVYFLLCLAMLAPGAQKDQRALHTLAAMCQQHMDTSLTAVHSDARYHQNEKEMQGSQTGSLCSTRQRRLVVT
jgi:hypothetical protein